MPVRHPVLADLTVGWGPFTQTYTSRVYCVPGEIVEAVSGSASTTIPREILKAVGYEDADLSRETTMEGVFESLVTRWTVEPVRRSAAAVATTTIPRLTTEVAGSDGVWTEVALSVTFQFTNPALGFAVGQLADDKVDEMVQAFEQRARETYGR